MWLALSVRLAVKEVNGIYSFTSEVFRVKIGLSCQDIDLRP